jgi:pimeloyl-ACP methyl ester carboxylesterase
MPTLTRPDIDLHYEDSGSGPPLLLVAGLACDSMSWLPVAAPLARSFRLIRPDNRGVGRTRPQDAASSIEAMADDCAALIRHLGLRRVHLLGHSMGAFIARRLAVRHPDLVDRLVLAACGEAAGARNLALFRDLADDYPPASDPARWHRRLYAWIFTRRFFEDPAKLDAATRWALDSPYPQSAAGFRRQVDAMANDDAAASDASRIAARTLILIGREDLLFPIASAQRFAATIAGARLAIVEDAAHALHTERPDAFVAAVAEFLGR